MRLKTSRSASCTTGRTRRSTARRTMLLAAAAGAAMLLAGCPAPTEDPAAPAPTKDVAHVACTGKVVGTDGKPIPGATVTVFRTVRTYVNTPSRYEAIARITPEADGSFSFSVPADERAVVVVAEARGRAIGWQSLDLREGQTDATVTLGEALTLAGTVVDDDAKPIARAKVVLRLRPADRGGGKPWLFAGGSVASLVTTTGTDGRFSFANVPVGYAGEFRVEAAGRGILDTLQQRRGTAARAPAGDIELTLPAAARIEAVAVEKGTGKPVGDVTLMAVDYSVLPPEPGRCVSKQAGRYAWDKLPAGRYQLSVAVPAEGMANWAGAPVTVAVKAGEAKTDVKIELMRGGVAELTFVDAADGTPVKRPVFGLSSKLLKGWAFGGAGEDGVGRMRLVPAEYKVNWTSAYRYAAARDAGTITVEADKTSRLEVKLTKSPRFHGVVRDPAGKPLAGASVCALPGWRYAASDKEGKYELWKDFQRWPFHASFLLAARHVDRNLAASMEVVGKPTGAIDLKLAPALTITGQVVGPAGKPVRGAKVSVLIDHKGPEPGLWEGVATTDAAGRYEVKALPPGRDYVLRFRAEGRATVDVAVPSGSVGGRRVEARRVVLQPVTRLAAEAVAREIAIPDFPGTWAIWGSTGRDSRGHIWFGVSSRKIETPSAHLFEYDPKTGKVTDRGSVVSQLQKAGVNRQGEQQMKIHSKIFQVGGYLYFCSMDEKDEDMAKDKLPTWGSHVWRLRLKDHAWEHLLTTPDALIGMAAGGGYVYALGYFRHALHQYDTATAKTRRVEVGAIGGHISRGLLADGRGHVYVPRIAPDTRGGPAVTLVEYDARLKEIGQSPLKYYMSGSPLGAHGITGYATLPDGSIAFVTSNGRLSLLKPSPRGPAKLTDVGWLHPRGPSYTAILFADAAGRRLFGAARGAAGPYEWIVYDLKTGRHALAGFRIVAATGSETGRTWLFGSDTRDDAGRCYVVGTQPPAGETSGEAPILLRVEPPEATAK